MAVSGRDMFVAAVFSLMSAGAAHAGCCNVPPPSPPPPPPPMQCNGCGGGVKVVVPPVNISPPSVEINYGAPRIGVSVRQNVTVSGGGGFLVSGGGGFVGAVDAGVSGGMLNVSTSAMETVTRTMTAERVIQAVCLDDRGNPHAASQTFAGEAVAAAYRGEIFRCMAGTQMRVSIGGKKDGRATFDGARTFDCEKGQALSFDGQDVSCRVQEAKRPCNERSLLRRYGAGLKTVQIRTTETATVERRQSTEQMMQMSFDGGVGQSV